MDRKENKDREGKCLEASKKMKLFDMQPDSLYVSCSASWI